MTEPNASLKLAASYVSMFQNDDENSPDFMAGWEQQDTIYERAKSQGYEVVKEFADLDASAELGSRPGFNSLIFVARSPSAPFEAIIVTSMDRFSPVAAEQAILSQQLETYGIDLITVGGF